MRGKDNFFLLASIAFLVLSIINFAIVTNLSTFTPVWFVVDLLLTIYWIFRRNPFFLAMLTAAISQLFFLPAITSMNFLDQRYETAESIKIATYNVRQFQSGESVTLDYVLSILEKEDVDVACIQEFSENWNMKDEDFWKRISESFPYIFVQDAEFPKTARLAILSKHPVQDGKPELFKNGINGAMYADINVNGKTVRIINSHLQTTGVTQNRKYGQDMMVEGYLQSTEIRREQAEFLKKLIDNTHIPTILCGDFNDTPFSYSYRIINRRMHDGFKSGGSGFANTFIGGFFNLLRIDYIFNSKDFECTNYQILDHRFSDHKPVISALFFRNEE